MSLIAVVVKKSRVDQPGSHTYKFQGGILNTTAQRGRGYYVRRVNGQEQGELLQKLQVLCKQRV